MNILIKSAVKNFIIFSTALYASISLAQNKLAIVIDDVGYHSKEDAAVFAMPREISVAIIPAAPYARVRNQEAKSQGRDILIHMPMQPISAIKIEDGGLHLGMSAAQVNDRVNTAKNIVRDAIGMNNHMGSAATADPQLMTYLMTALQEKHLFFLDSRTIGKSVAGKIAKEQGVRSLDRHIFLDDSNEFADVQRQFKAAIHYARKHGIAIVIGHPRPNTIAVLQAGLRNLPEDIQLVGMGNLWRNEKVIPPKPFILLFSEMPAPTSMEPFEPVGLLRGVPK
ncbi:divergent polysaccharide deacetylase family protein [Haemophilus influenzae]|uniref:divergent polysaccharide deacetylase family protein n=1 Tax=Haemophilus influenzae TaxID=727 RepID=UPI000D01DFE1|nr:divergent polysaccharide deacetylase family protein [Haemophilus influenzae]MCK9140813.1 divergent polysaccharide deacetylase family protein [Haemophilus influenzae]PRL62926.1 Divergent polysaccharide deacetylase [Haemophilus influenzae]PRL66104.1 Divergent polysaccharide deacetylase [Haemophilus influenzae]